MRRRALIGCAAASLLGGCAQALPPPAAATPVVRTRGAAPVARGFDCTTHSLVIVTVSSCGDGGFHILSPAGE